MKPKNLRLQRARRVLIYVLALLVMLAATPSAHAFNSILSSWRATYPNSASDENAAASGSACLLCHSPNSYSQFNAYGWELLLNGRDFMAIESLNSDGDPTGASNLDEIMANTQPGWTPGANNSINGGSVTNSALPPAGIAGSLDPPLANQPPTANANGPYNGTVGIPVAFSSAGSADPDGTIVAYDWNFGDGSIGTGPSPSHTYVNGGTFNVSLTVTDDAGGTGTAGTTATIALGNQPPIADPNGPYTGTSGVPVSFDGSGSIDPDGAIVSYDWDFGDGTAGTGMMPSHTYTMQGVQGTYNVTLTVTDDGGAIDSATTSVTINAANQAPTANPNGPYSGTVNVAVTFDGTGSTDPDGIVSSYAWDFGDGSTGMGPTPSHSYQAEGTYNVTLTVTDDGGLTGSAVTTATIGAAINEPPIANANGPYGGTVGLPLTFDSAGSHDPDGTLVAYDWNFGDGTTGTGPNPTHTYTTAGTYNVSLTVTDNNGAMDSSATTAIIGLGNQAPIANANGPYNGTVGNPLQLSSNGSSDPDGAITAYSWDFGDGTSGTGPNPTHTYTAAGTYNITLTVTDDSGAMDSNATSATIVPITSGADVFLTELWAPRSFKLEQGKKDSIEISALGNSTILQGATVRLQVTAPSAGLTVVVEEEAISEELDPDRHAEQFEFKADITCAKAGMYTLGWSATIEADQNSDLSNDNMTGETSVLCTDESSDDDDEHEEEDDDDDEEEEEEEDDDDDSEEHDD
ncbi:MAG: PKD domain-containing protein [Deltaproteobacteria bacterium]|nr:PKD domain-containing protein [Deltaproteobacteria bacterium]